MRAWHILAVVVLVQFVSTYAFSYPFSHESFKHDEHEYGGDLEVAASGHGGHGGGGHGGGGHGSSFEESGGSEHGEKHESKHGKKGGEGHKKKHSWDKKEKGNHHKVCQLQ